MLKKLASFLPKGSFARPLALLSGGTLLGQLCLVVSAPLLTRLFTPAEFGLFAVFLALFVVVSMGYSGRYEFALPVCSDDSQAAALAQGALWLIVTNTAVVGLFLYFAGEALTVTAGKPELAPFLWIFAPALFVQGLVFLASYWSLRRQTYRVNSLSKLVLGGSQAVSQLTLGVAGFGTSGLIIGYVVGLALQSTFLLYALAADDRRAIARARFAEIGAALREHWRFPAWTAPAGMLISATQMLPSVFLAIFYGPAIAGFYALSQRVVGMPVRMLSMAAGQVFLSQVPKLEQRRAEALFWKTSRRFLLLGIIGMSPLVLFGPDLFAFAFGEPWRYAGEIVRWLVPLFLSRFIVVPISQTLNIYGQQHWHLITSAASLAAMVGSMTMGWSLEWPVVATVALYSLTAMSIQGLVWWLSLRALRNRLPDATGGAETVAPIAVSGE